MDCDEPFVEVYIDDILIYSMEEKQHLIHLKKVMDRLRDVDLTTSSREMYVRRKRSSLLGKHL